MNMRYRTKNLSVRVFLYLLAVYCLTIVLSTRIARLGRFLTSEEGHGGDLYLMSGLSSFIAEKNRVPLTNDRSLEDADIIVYADSFGEQSVGDGAFHMRLEKLVDRPIFLERHRYQYKDPPAWLKSEKAGPFRAKILIHLQIERNIRVRPLPGKNLHSIQRAAKAKTLLGRAWKARETESASYWKSALFDNSKIEYVVKNSFLSRRLFDVVAMGRLRIFGKTSMLVPKVSLSPKMLFYYESVNSFKMSLDDRNIEKIVSRLHTTDKLLRERYDMSYVYVPIPNKYTIYHDFADELSTYNDFLPILSEKLAHRGVICVNLYPEFMRHRDEMLYWPDDTHWNDKGIELAVKMTDAALRERGLIERLPPDHEEDDLQK